MTDTSRLLPLNFNSEKARVELYNIVNNLPPDVEVYLIGGSLRNALFRYYHNKVLQQRDYDQIITRNSEGYYKFLAEQGYTIGNIDRPSQKIMRKALTASPGSNEGYDEWIVFDTHIVDGTTAMDNLKFHVGLTINGFAISLRDILSEDWQDKLIVLPDALEDLRKKQLHVNFDGYKDQAANFFACLRFMSAGFTPPPSDEVKVLLEELPKVESERYERNIQKVYRYVGGEDNAKKLLASLGVDTNVFNEKEVKAKLAI